MHTADAVHGKVHDMSLRLKIIANVFSNVRIIFDNQYAYGLSILMITQNLPLNA